MALPPGGAQNPQLNLLGQEDGSSSVISIPTPEGDMQIDISRMMPEDAELILAVLADEKAAENPEVQARMQELLQRLATTTEQFDFSEPPPMQRDTRGGPNMMTPVGNVSQMDIGEAQSRKARARHQPYTGQESALYPGMKY